jgi:hypothetical protein
MNSFDEIIKWLEEEGVTTKKEALEKLKPYVNSNIHSWASHVGAGNYGVSLAGTINCINKVVKHFEAKENKISQ